MPFLWKFPVAFLSHLPSSLLPGSPGHVYCSGRCPPARTPHGRCLQTLRSQIAMKCPGIPTATTAATPRPASLPWALDRLSAILHRPSYWIHLPEVLHQQRGRAGFPRGLTLSVSVRVRSSSVLVPNQILRGIWRLCGERGISPMLQSPEPGSLICWLHQGWKQQLGEPGVALHSGTSFITLQRLGTIHLGREAESFWAQLDRDAKGVRRSRRRSCVTCFALIRSYHESAWQLRTEWTLRQMGTMGQ